MWVFGYGSLMWDGWETAYGCLRRTPAELSGYRRIFNRKSPERWGTQALPGLTLNLIAGGTCRGVAFHFDDAALPDIAAYLCARETCDATELAVRLADDTEVRAHTYLYEGERLIEEELALEARAAMILAGVGLAGASYDYIKGVRAHLAELGVADPEIDALWDAVETLKIQAG